MKIKIINTLSKTPNSVPIPMNKKQKVAKRKQQKKQGKQVTTRWR